MSGMERLRGSEEPQPPAMDAVDREAHEMFFEDAKDALREALHINQILKTILEQIEKGVLNSDMTLKEVVDALKTKKEGLIGGDIEEEGED